MPLQNNKNTVALKNSHKAFVEELDSFIQKSNIKIQLAEISEIVSLAYIAKTYFNKSRSWLHQRINGDAVNSQPATFTKDEIKTFNFALKDISKKINSTSISI